MPIYECIYIDIYVHIHPMGRAGARAQARPGQGLLSPHPRRPMKGICSLHEYINIYTSIQISTYLSLYIYTYIYIERYYYM